MKYKIESVMSKLSSYSNLNLVFVMERF